MSRRQYPFHLIEPKWQQHWAAEGTFRAFNPGDAVPAEHPFGKRHGMEGKVAGAAELPKKFYILDMFPYPSGAGLHVGHPEGYTATDILARYRRAQGFNVLHPMGWDAFGLPAEQYAVKTGQHPRVTTERNVATFKRQIQSLGFSYDWSRELSTTDPEYFRWTQWIFLQLYNSYFHPTLKRAMPISLLEDAMSDEPKRANEWMGDQFLEKRHRSWKDSTQSYKDKQGRAWIDNHRLAYAAEANVWWCEELGTVLANEEVIEGKSEVGGFPVVRKPMRQWMLRITAYADRLLDDLGTIEWSHSLKEMQRNWIGRSVGAEVEFPVPEQGGMSIKVFTTRPDTLFGATYLVLAPDHWAVEGITASDCLSAVEAYQQDVAKKSDLERTELATEKTGTFTGAHAVNPVNGERIPIWIADYVLASYGTGAIMAVPAHDERDWEFAKRFHLPIKHVVGRRSPKARDIVPSMSVPEGDRTVVIEINGQPTLFFYSAQECDIVAGFAINSANPTLTLNGLPTSEAITAITAWLESKGLGRKTVNYKLRDWLFSRQRYWGEPFPIIWKRDAYGNLYHEALPESTLPVLPPPLDDYKPTPDGQPPLARAKDWVTLPDGSTRETNTMPQWAGSCWYYLRYLDAKNGTAFVGREAESYWMGSAEGSEFRVQGSASENSKLETRNSKLSPATPGVDLYVGGTEHAVLHLLYARFWHKVLFDLGHVSTPEPFFKLVNQGLILGEDGRKMAKSLGNVINPDDMVQEFGADALRLYEMFMGPLQDTKPWSTKGVEGVYRFLGRVWRLFIDEASEVEFEQACTADAREMQRHLAKIRLAPNIQDLPADAFHLKPLHACIKKVTEDLEAMRFNTAISAMMVFVSEAMCWNMKPVSALRTFLQLLAPFAPHLSEELWELLHRSTGQPVPSLTYAPWPAFDPALLVETTLEIPVQVNGKLRDVIRVPADAANADLEAAALKSEKVRPFLEGRTIRKIIVVPKKLVNIAVA